MTSEKREPGGESQLSISSLQSNEELASFHLQHGSDDLAGISHREVESFHYGLIRDEHLVPQSYGQGMPFDGDLSVFHQPGQDCLNKPVSIGNVKETDLGHAFGDSVASANVHANDLDSSLTGRNIMVSGADVVRRLQTCRPGGEYNGGISLSVHNPTSKELGPSSLWMDTSVGEMNDTTRPWLTGNQFIGTCSPSASGHNPTIEEFAPSNFDFTGEGQPNYPEVLDGDFLSLGCGAYEETDSLCDIHFPDSEQGRVLLPLFNTFPDQNIARGSLNCSSTMANDISSFSSCTGGYRNLTNEDPYRAQSLGQSASGFPHQVWRATQLPNPSAMQNAEGSLNPIMNAGRLSHQAPVTNRDRSSENNGLPNAAWLRATRIPSSSSSTVVGFTQPASERPQNPPITTVRNFSPVPVMAPPFVGVPGWHGQSVAPVTDPCYGVPRSRASHGQSGSVVVPSLGVSRSMPGQGQSGHLVQAITASAGVATEGSPLSKNVRVEQARKGASNQSQASVSVNLPKNAHACASTSEQQIGRVNVPQSSTIHSGPSLKRGASNLLPNVPAAQRRKTRSVIPSGPSMPKLRQIAPHVPPASIDLKPHISRLLQNPALLSSLMATQSTHHIKWNVEDKESPSGYQCPICKRDLSYTPEGTMYQPDKLLPTSVLPCGHYFHSSCLLRITPADQAGNPPCIPCALDG